MRLSAQRARVLEHLQQAGVSTTVVDLATRLGLHTNTVREHLDALVTRGLATRTVLTAVGRGRPADAVAAGQEWGRRLAADLPSGSSAQARRHVVGLLAELGFAPQSDARAGSVRLLRCPLLDAARLHPDVVCPVHLGMVRGVLAALGGDPRRAALLPFSEPGACRLQLNIPIAAVQR